MAESVLLFMLALQGPNTVARVCYLALFASVV